MSDSNSAIRHIATVAVYVDDQDRALDFWTRQVGLEKRVDERMDATTRWIEVGPAGSPSCLVIFPKAAMPDWTERKPSVVWRCEDVDAAYAASRPKGWPSRRHRGSCPTAGSRSSWTPRATVTASGRRAEAVGGGPRAVGTAGFSWRYPGVVVRTVPTLEDLRRHRSEILRITAAYGASNLRVFGSVARGDARPGSDVDLLADFEPGRSVWDLAGLTQDLEELLGVRIEIGTRVPPRIAESVRAESVPL
jgi:predicted nucleotidyltransferase